MCDVPKCHLCMFDDFFIHTKGSTRGPNNYIVVCVNNSGEGRGGSEIKLDKTTKDQNMRPKQFSGNPLWGGYLLITSNLWSNNPNVFPNELPKLPNS
jgi:hypothetical protein